MKTACDRPQRAGPPAPAPPVLLTVGLDRRGCELTRWYCLKHGCVCDHVRSGREALAYLRKHSGRPPATILCAEVLADGSWLQVLEWVPCRLILVSPLADARLWAEAINLGACDLLSNPFSRTELEWSIDSARLAGAGTQPRHAGGPLVRAAND